MIKFHSKTLANYCLYMDSKNSEHLEYSIYNCLLSIEFYEKLNSDKIEIEKSSKSKSQNKGEAWNGKDFVVNIDTDDKGTSTWIDSQKYGFVSAGGGKWYSNSLKQLFVGARIFAMIPKKGYIGVGIVKETSIPIKEFHVFENNVNKSILDEASSLRFKEATSLIRKVISRQNQYEVGSKSTIK